MVQVKDVRQKLTQLRNVEQYSLNLFAWILFPEAVPLVEAALARAGVTAVAKSEAAHPAQAAHPAAVASQSAEASDPAE
jgi:hypothetical protein